MAAGGLATMMLAAWFYHLHRNEPNAPALATCLLAVSVIIGRWPK